MSHEAQEADANLTEIARLRAESRQAERRYQSAINGRAKFREAYRRTRADLATARAHIHDLRQALELMLDGEITEAVLTRARYALYVTAKGREE